MSTGAIRAMRPAGLTAIAIVVLLSTSCLPPAGWTAAGFTVDASHSSEATSIIGHCFRLRLDAYVLSCPSRIELRGGESVDVAGCLRVITPGSSPSRRVDLPRGSRIVVEKVLSWRNVETSSLTPYIRVNGALIDANDLFRYTGASEGRPHGLTYAEHLLDPCEAP